MNKLENLKQKYEILHTIDASTPKKSWYDKKTMLKLLDVLNDYENTLFFTYDDEKNMYVICKLDRKTYENLYTLIRFYDVYEHYMKRKWMYKNIVDDLENIFYQRGNYRSRWHSCHEIDNQYDLKPYMITHYMPSVGSESWNKKYESMFENKSSKQFLHLMYTEYYEGSILQEFNTKLNQPVTKDKWIPAWNGNVLLYRHYTPEEIDRGGPYNRTNFWRNSDKYYEKRIKELKKLHTKKHKKMTKSEYVARKIKGENLYLPYDKE